MITLTIFLLLALAASSLFVVAVLGILGFALW